MKSGKGHYDQAKGKTPNWKIIGGNGKRHELINKIEENKYVSGTARGTDRYFSSVKSVSWGEMNIKRNKVKHLELK